MDFKTESGAFQYGNGDYIKFVLHIDQQKFSALVARAARNKNGEAVNGCIRVQAKKLDSAARTLLGEQL